MNETRRSTRPSCRADRWLATLGAALSCLSLTCQTERTPSHPTSVASGAIPPAAVERAARTITPEALRADIVKLSADELAGRAPGTPGDHAARAYLAEQLAAIHVEPGRAEEGWEQPVDLVGLRTAMPKTWTFERGAESVGLTWRDQYIAGSGVQSERGAIDRAEIVFVGYGIQAPEYGWDDFKGRDLKGKILLVLNNDPDWDPALFGGTARLYYGRWTYKFESAARQGAAGAIIIHTTPSAGYPFQVVQSTWGGERFELPSDGGPTITVKGWVTEDAARTLVQLGKQDLAALVQAARSKSFEPVPLGVTTSLHFENTIRRVRTANVYGIVRGADPRVAGEPIVLSAHHDHLGVGTPDASGDAIYNGALDNAAGDAQVLGIARAFKALPAAPRRSLIVLFTAAEEQGLLGSLYFAEHPPVPAGAIAANINFDCGNIWGRTHDVTQVGRGKSTLDEVLARIAARQGRIVKADQFPDRGSFYRSDQFSFAKVGVPALYLKTGTDFLGRPEGWGKEQILRYEAHDYHQPSDEIRPDWSFEGMVEDDQLAFLVALEVANADAPPQWYAGDEFEAARKAAQASLRR